MSLSPSCIRPEVVMEKFVLVEEVRVPVFEVHFPAME